MAAPRREPIAATHSLELDLNRFALVRLSPDAAVPSWVDSSPFRSVTRTPEELSLLCPESQVPSSIDAQRGLRCLKVRGPLDSSEVGVLESLAHPLARAGISILALSTYDTDYLLVRESDLEAAIQALSSAGHTIHGQGAADDLR